MNGVLVDTSVWVDHFRRSNGSLVHLLSIDRAWVHPWVIGEVACGAPPQRTATLQAMRALQVSAQPTPDEVLAFVERDQLFGSGCGLIDLTLLASTLMTPGLQLWTMDARLARWAQQFGVCFTPSLHEPGPAW